MYYDYVGLKGNRLYGIVNINCDEKGFNQDNCNIKIIKFWGTAAKVFLKIETSDYWKITSLIERKEKSGYEGLTYNLTENYDILSPSVKEKLSKKYAWEKLKE